MGNPKFPRKKYTTPLHPWKEERIKTERELIKKYGLKNHKEVWKAKTFLGKHRQQARELLAKMGTNDPQIKKESDQLLLHLTRLGVLSTGSSLDDVLALETESVLSRRLQTLVYLKGLSTTPDHSRQLINHGHIAVGGRKVTIPSYMVIKNEETDIGYTNVSPLNELSHPARPKADVFKSVSAVVDDKKQDETKKEKTKPIEKSKVKDDEKKDLTKDISDKSKPDKIEDKGEKSTEKVEKTSKDEAKDIPEKSNLDKKEEDFPKDSIKKVEKTAEDVNVDKSKEPKKQDDYSDKKTDQSKEDKQKPDSNKEKQKENKEGGK